MRATHKTPQLSRTGTALANRLIRAIADYETCQGPTPVWCSELATDSALALLLSATRIGMLLPSGETLEDDMRERSHALPPSLRRPGKD